MVFLGWKRENCHDETQLSKLGQELSSELKKVSSTRQMNIKYEFVLQSHGKHYTSQKSIGLYKATGIASDW